VNWFSILLVFNISSIDFWIKKLFSYIFKKLFFLQIRKKELSSCTVK